MSVQYNKRSKQLANEWEASHVPRSRPWKRAAESSKFETHSFE